MPSLSIRPLPVGSSSNCDRLNLSKLPPALQRGVRAAYSQWKDSSDYESRTPRLTFYVTVGELQFALIGEQRQFDIGYTVRTASAPSDRSFNFDGTGFGGSINWLGPRWGAYVEAVGYDYGSDLERLVLVANSPLIERFPAIQSLVGILVQAETALDYQALAGVQRQFGRSTLAFDLHAIKGAIDGAEGRGVSASLQVAATRRLDLELTIGVNDSDGFATTVFGGLAITLHN